MKATNAAGSQEARPTVHLLKLCVGAETVDDLAVWQVARSAERKAAGQDQRPRHVTRMWPRRSEALVRGGSIFWVIRGVIQVRQRIEALLPVTGADGIVRCAIVMSPELIRVEPRVRGPFQGWRYLEVKDAPRDISAAGAGEADLPPHLAEALAALGVSSR